MITGLYIAIFAVAQVFMIVLIGRCRIREKIILGSGDSKALEIKRRVYGNFTEIVPSAILLMLIAELGGAPLWIIHVMGGLLIVSRILHAVGMAHLRSPYRMAGMFLAMAVFLIGAILCTSLAVPRLL